MPRVANGVLDQLADGRFAARVTLAGRSRRQFILVACSTRADAQARCTAMAGLAARLRRAGLVDEIEKLLEMAARARAGRPWEVVTATADVLCAGGTEAARASVVPTFAEFADEWTSGRLHASHPDHVRAKDSSDDISRIKLYFADELGPKRLDEITLADIDAAMANLPEDLERTTRRHIAQVVGRIMKLAVYPGRHIATSPIPRGWLPRPGKSKARSYVYPDEDVTLLACRTVPLWRRLLWGLMAREGTRGPSEALAFRWRHVNLAVGTVRLDTNKTDDPRQWALSPGTLRALEAWKSITTAPTEPATLIFLDEDGRQPHETQVADLLRQDLKTAGVERPELFEHNAHRLQVRAHDLRASFITVALAAGRSETWVTDRTGHTTSDQLRNYRRAARTVAELSLGDFQALDQAIPELAGLPIENPPTVSEHSDSALVVSENTEQFAVSDDIEEASRILVPLIGVRISAPEPSQRVVGGRSRTLSRRRTVRRGNALAGGAGGAAGHRQTATRAADDPFASPEASRLEALVRGCLAPSGVAMAPSSKRRLLVVLGVLLVILVAFFVAGPPGVPKAAKLPGRTRNARSPSSAI